MELRSRLAPAHEVEESGCRLCFGRTSDKRGHCKHNGHEQGNNTNHAILSVIGCHIVLVFLFLLELKTNLAFEWDFKTYFQGL